MINPCFLCYLFHDEPVSSDLSFCWKYVNMYYVQYTQCKHIFFPHFESSSETKESDLSKGTSPTAKVDQSTPSISLVKKQFAGRYAISSEEFSSEMVIISIYLEIKTFFLFLDLFNFMRYHPDDNFRRGLHFYYCFCDLLLNYPFNLGWGQITEYCIPQRKSTFLGWNSYFRSSAFWRF